MAAVWIVEGDVVAGAAGAILGQGTRVETVDVPQAAAAAAAVEVVEAAGAADGGTCAPKNYSDVESA